MSTPCDSVFYDLMRELYGNDVCADAKQLIKTIINLEKTKAATTYLMQCIVIGTPPSFVRQKFPNKELSNDHQLRRNVEWTLTEKELFNKRKHARELQKSAIKLDATLSNRLNDEHWKKLQHLLDESRAKVKEEQKSSHDDKLRRLNPEMPIQVNDSNITQRKAKQKDIKCMNAIFNLADIELTPIQNQVLSKGLKFGIHERKIDTYELLSRFELCAQSFNNLKVASRTDEKLKATDPRSTFIQKLQEMAFEFIKLSQSAIDNLTPDERAELISLSKRKDIIISKADKGNAIVIQKVEDYRAKVSAILNLDGKFETLPDDPTVKRERKLRDWLKTIWDNSQSRREYSKRCDMNVIDRIRPCGSRAGVLYGLPKVHKNGTPIRPIISAVKTYNYQLASYLDSIIKPAIFSEENDMLIDTIDFVNKVRNLNHLTEKYMVSFDVESLFTNIPTDETIEIILSKIYGPAKIPSEKTGKPIINPERKKILFHGLTSDELKEMLEVCTKRSHFQFDGKFYDQVDGVAMGSPLGPLFANAFMVDFVRKNKSELNRLGVIKWCRYVDDIFATLSDKTQAEKILSYLNTQHPNIKFTIEHECDGKLPFLDTTVIRGSDTYKTTMYRKKTFTGVYLNWLSLTTKRYKIGLIHCLMDRIWKICIEEEDRKHEIDKLKSILARNDYPNFVVEREINKFINARETTAGTHQSSPPSTDSIRTDKRFIVLPYVSRRAESFAKRLKLHVQGFFPTVDFNVAFKAPCEMGRLFPFKDKVKQVTSRSLVIYRINCMNCEADYIGKTERILCYRLHEHEKTSSSICHQHELKTGHKMDYANVTILDTADSDYKLLMKERLHIIARKPSLNRQLNSQSQYQIKTLIIAAHPDPIDEASTY